MAEIYKRESCRVCTKKNLKKVLTLGPTPLANAFLEKSQINQGEKFYPLDLYFCTNCGFIQLGHVVSPQVLFNDYVYVSSTSKVFINHFEVFSEKAFKEFNLNTSSLVIDLGSNDGILLKPFKKLGTRVLGIEPAKKIAKIAQTSGIETIPEYFSKKLAKSIVTKYGKADIVSATNVFAHIDDLDEVVDGLKIMLKDKGVFVIEAPYLIDFLKKGYFDLVYHEHLSYWSVGSLIKLFKRFYMTVVNVDKVPVHGGSIRVFVKKNIGRPHKSRSVGKFLAEEKSMDLDKIKTYLNYSKVVYDNKIKLLSLLERLKNSGKTIAAYGAPAKGNTLLNFFDIGSETLDFVADDSSFKQGLYTPGKHLKVVSSNFIYKAKPDYILILAWNFANSIMAMHERYTKNGGRFIIPVPKPRII